MPICSCPKTSFGKFELETIRLWRLTEESTNFASWENCRKRKEIALGWVRVTVDKWSLQPLAQLGEVISLRNPTERSSFKTKQMKDSDDW